MLHRIFYIVILIYLSVFCIGFATFNNGEVLGAGDKFLEDSYASIAYAPGIETKTAFLQKEITEEVVLEYETTYVDDPEIEYGTEVVYVGGVPGKKTLTYLVTYWEEDIIDKVLLTEKIDPPVTELIKKGKKIIWKELKTSDAGKIRYWHKMRVWATKYDHTCPGCNHTTAVGAYLQKGVCATDPKVIPLRTSFYVPGYGKCTALDVGGGIKGNEIDLGYEDASKAPWGASYTDIYIMDNPPN